jgi:hypothetical protein
MPPTRRNSSAHARSAEATTPDRDFERALQQIEVTLGASAIRSIAGTGDPEELLTAVTFFSRTSSIPWQGGSRKETRMSRYAWLLPLSLGALLACDASEPTAVTPDASAYVLADGAVEVLIDIQPLGQIQSVINTHSKSGHLAVAVLSATDFDATTIDYATVSFLGAPALHLEEAASEDCAETFAMGHFTDVNVDLALDAVVHFDPAVLMFPDEPLYCLYGNLKDGTAFSGCAAAVVR